LFAVVRPRNCQISVKHVSSALLSFKTGDNGDGVLTRNPQHGYHVLLVACVGYALRQAVLVLVAFVVTMGLEILWLAGDGVSEFLT
jgi:uncharacterized membrane protein (Fun14 family)